MLFGTALYAAAAASRSTPGPDAAIRRHPAGDPYSRRIGGVDAPIRHALLKRCISPQPGSVRPIAPLRDKPLKAHGAGVSEHGSSFTLGTVQMLAELNASIHLT
jgi:hypothetical protein